MQELRHLNQDSNFQFLLRWYGEPDKSEIPYVPPMGLPRVLREWHSMAARWSKPITVMDRPIPLQQIEIIDGMVVFWEENQGGQIWAFRQVEDDTNPDILRCDPSEDPLEWIDTNESLSEFLLHATVYEAVWGANHHVTAQVPDQDSLEEILNGFIELALPAWSWPAETTRILFDSQRLALVLAARHSEQSDGTIYIRISSNVRESLEELQGFEASWLQK